MQFHEQQKILNSLLKKPQNALCADCNSKSPCWASLDFGVFVCMNCSGAHRSLGQSVTRIKSTKLDTWSKDWVWHMQLNNKLINQYYEANLNPIVHKKPNPSSTLAQIKRYVNDKYVKRLFSQQNQDDPITNLKNGKPPLKRLQSPNELTKNASSTSETKIPQNAPSMITNKPSSKKQQNLLDDSSNMSNKGPSVNNQKRRQQINLFQDENISGHQYLQVHNGQNNNNQHTYNKDHYNSFSGKGAKHSSTGSIGFDDIFGEHHGQPKKNNPPPLNTNFNNIVLQNANSKYTQDPFTPTMLPSHHQHQRDSHHHYGQIYHQNYPHMNIHSTVVGSNFHHGINAHHQPTHVTMNINMNMYTNVMNVNLLDNTQRTNNIPNSQITLSSQAAQPKSTNANINDHIKLDLNDFKIQSDKKQTKKSNAHNTNQKSWVDDWK